MGRKWKGQWIGHFREVKKKKVPIMGAKKSAVRRRGYGQKAESRNL